MRNEIIIFNVIMWSRPLHIAGPIITFNSFAACVKTTGLKGPSISSLSFFFFDFVF